MSTRRVDMIEYYSQVRVLGSFALLLSEMSIICLQLRILFRSASGVTDMGLFKSFDVLLIEILGKVQESYRALFLLSLF